MKLSLNERVMIYWIGLIIIIGVTWNMNGWLPLVLAFAYGFIMAQLGFYAFPFMYRWNRRRS